MSEVKESAPKHTAGWHVSPKAIERGDFPVLDWSGRAVCLAVEEGEARLIASAPDLLEALTELFASYKELADSGDAGFWSLEDTDEGKRALAAIAKATGADQ